MLRDGWVLNKWILPPNYWMTIWHKAKILMNHLFQFYQTVIVIFTSDWKDVTKVSQVVRIIKVHLFIPCQTPSSDSLSSCDLSFLLSIAQNPVYFITLEADTTASPNSDTHQEWSCPYFKTSTVFTSPTPGTYTCFVNVWIPNTPVKNMY